MLPLTLSVSRAPSAESRGTGRFRRLAETGVYGWTCSSNSSRKAVNMLAAVRRVKPAKLCGSWTTSMDRRAGVSPAFPMEGTATLALNPHHLSARMVKAAKMAALRSLVPRRVRQQVKAPRGWSEIRWPRNEGGIFGRANPPSIDILPL